MARAFRGTAGPARRVRPGIPAGGFPVGVAQQALGQSGEPDSRRGRVRFGLRSW